MQAPDAEALEGALNRGAAIMAGLGDDRSGDERRAAMLGMLADPEAALEFLTGGHDPQLPIPKAPVKLYVHLHALTIAGNPGVARVEGLGAHTLETIQEWCYGRDVRIQPVIDLNTCYSVDAYEAPAPIREQTFLKDATCVFPWCDRRGRVQDHDHIDPYRASDDGGPPGQTNSHNQARLCRYHHRVKTHTAWTYQRLPDGGYHWTGPDRQSWIVDHTGTHVEQSAA